MNRNNICSDERFAFLKYYINEHYLFYSITLVTFAVLFGLVWILRTYTYFEKNKISRGTIPKFPYGNFGPVIRGASCLHLFLWKHHNRFKRKDCKLGGLFLYIKPVFLHVDVATDFGDGTYIFPYECKLQQNDIDKLLSKEVLNIFLSKFNNNINETLPERLLKTKDSSSALKEYLLESICLMFGFKSFEMLDELNYLLEKRYIISPKYFLLLCSPLLRKTFLKPKLHPELKELFLEIIETRKKNDLHESDLLQSCIDLFNQSNYIIDDIVEEIFTLLADCITYTYATLEMCLFELANNEEIQNELIGEVRRFNRNNKKVTQDGLVDLPYVNAVVKETLRKYPPIATVIKSSNGIAKNGEWCPEKNSLIFSSNLAIHRDSQYYIEPEAFDPERFMEKQLLPENTFVPFGLGPRNQFYLDSVTLQVTLFLISIFSNLKVGFQDNNVTLKYDCKLLYLSPEVDQFNLKFEKINSLLYAT